ncbi:beta-1,4-galactosyltransferase galt-1-like [Xenopus tropicalis]|uniref:Glycosyltransferase family 92 protein n=1 Tax=Xenopus tropicalis TaxID=8364 RepID=A0A803JXG0_XENTR|nr:beta-1,4-galactosyltransferase galt-1-like [Xenopus tropicalis]
MRKICFTGCLLVMITLTSVYYHRMVASKWNIEYKEIKRAEKNITPLGDNKTFIIHAYYDDRVGKNIRTIAIVHHSNTAGFYCLFYCNTSLDGNAVPAYVNLHSDRFGFPYVTADIVCAEPNACASSHVSFFKNDYPKDDNLPAFQIKNRDSQPITSDFTVCMSTMFGNYSNALQFIQSIEMYKIMGVQRVTIYKNSASALMEKALQYYAAEGIVDIVEWPIDAYLSVSTKWHYTMEPKDIGYYGQIAALNDCVYRNMYRSKFVALIDTDEVILPVKYKDWTAMMAALEADNPNAGVFLFENHIFPKTVLDSDFEAKDWESVPGINILQHLYWEPSRRFIFNNRKMIVKPRTVIQTSVHSVLMANARSVHVSPDKAFLYHCREPEQPWLKKSQLIRDTTLLNYCTDLVENVDQVIQMVTSRKKKSSGFSARPGIGTAGKYVRKARQLGKCTL